MMAPKRPDTDRRQRDTTASNTSPSFTIKRKTPLEDFDDALRKVVSVPKSEVDRRLEEQRRAREQERREKQKKG